MTKTPITRLPAKPRRRLNAAERKENLLQGAQEIIRDRGLEGLTMESLAAHVGVNKALPYRHFGNRDDVLIALYKYENEKFDARLAALIDDAPDFEAKLRALLTAWYDDLCQGRGTPALMQARTQSHELETLRAARIQTSTEYIADIIQESYEIPRLQAKLASKVLLAGSQGLASIWQLSEAEDQALIDSFISMSIGAVEALTR
ncbi:MAG: TetR/AcrR family transcriptional regulator [Pseudomonadales bacterium]